MPNATPCHTLIHLVSDQTMQNVLPILALNPQRVVQVMSRDSGRFQKAALNTRHAVTQGGQLGFAAPQEWQEASVGAESPTIEETRRTVAELLGQNPGAWLNYTGGTKNMSIGAWLAGREEKAHLLYCDTPREFVSGTGDGALPPQTLQQVASKLTVPILLASQGLLRGREWERRGISPQEKKLGEVSYRLIQQHGQGFRDYRQCLLRHALPKGDGWARPADVERVNREPIPLPAHKDFDPFLEAALNAGLLRDNNGHLFYNTNLREPKSQKRCRRVERIAQGLTGTAFEAYVAMLLERSGRFTSFLSNIYPAGQHPEEHGFGETDFLAYEPASLALTLISCKSSPPGLEHLESLLARKGKFGGLFARTLLCVEYGGRANREQELRSRCQSLGIGCAIGDEIAPALGTEPEIPIKTTENSKPEMTDLGQEERAQLAE
jgi:hypothetical protein